MSSYSKPSSSFHKQILYQKQQKTKEKNAKSADNKEPTNVINPSLRQSSQIKSTSTIDNIKTNAKTLVPGRYPTTSPNNTVSSTTKADIVKSPQIIPDKATNQTTIASTPVVSSDTKNTTDFINVTKAKNNSTKNSNLPSGPGNKSHTGHNNNSSSCNKWRRNNFPVFYGGYPSPARINVPSTLPFFGRGYPTDASLYFQSGICPPHYSPVHHPHLRHHHLTQHRFLAVCPVAQTHPYHKYLAINHISNLRRSRSAHGSFRSKISSPHHPQTNAR